MHSYPFLGENIQTELVVVGGGITGALVSHALVEKGYEVTLIDKRDIGQGSTSATTSMLQYEIDVPMYKLAGMIGEKEAVACYKAGVDSIRRLYALVQEQELDCGFEWKKSLYLAHNKSAADHLKKELRLREKYGFDVEWLDHQATRELYGAQSHGGILSGVGGSVDAYRFAQELIMKNVKRGMQVYDQTEAKSFDFDGKRVTITTDCGSKIACRKVILCTGFEATRQLKEKIAKLFYTYVTISEQDIELNEKLRQLLLWDTDDPYTYMRTTSDNRLLVGGADTSFRWPFFQQKYKEYKEKQLLKNLEHILPGIDFVPDYNWGGTFASTKDGLPYIGQSPEYDYALFVLGFGGNGITFSAQAMDIIIDLLEGKPNELARYYRFGR